MNDQTTLSADEQAEIDRAAKIAEQNDRFRKTWGSDVTVTGQIVVTRGVASLSAGAQVQIMRAVQTEIDREGLRTEAGATLLKIVQEPVTKICLGQPHVAVRQTPILRTPVY